MYLILVRCFFSVSSRQGIKNPVTNFRSCKRFAAGPEYRKRMNGDDEYLCGVIEQDRISSLNWLAAAPKGVLVNG